MTHGSLIFASKFKSVRKRPAVVRYWKHCVLPGVLTGEFARVLHKVHCEKQFLKTQWSEKL